jgi:hypothetical protein
LALAIVTARYFELSYPVYVSLVALIFPIGMYFVGCAILAGELWHTYRGPDRRASAATAALALLGITLAVRVLSNVVPFGYSIFYNAPLILSVIGGLARYARTALPTLTTAQSRTVVNSILAAEVLLFACIMFPGQDDRPARLTTDWGTIYLSPSDAENSRRLIDFILEQKPQEGQVLLLPEAPMFYAFTGTEALTRWYSLVPGVLSPARERDYIAALAAHAPRYIALTARCTKEYRVAYFGIDYDLQILQWIDRNYRVVREIGKFRRDGRTSMAVLIYERKDLSLKEK